MIGPRDLELVRRLTNGDPTALEDAYGAYAPRCKAVAYRVLRDETQAEDAVQEAFLALWRHRDGLVVRTSGIGPWLFTVTRNAALASLRAQSRRSAREERAAEMERIDDPSEMVATRETAQSVRAALAGLPDEQRAVISYAYFGSMTLSQISQRTGAPLGTVKRRAQLGLSKLARTLRPQLS